MKLTLKREALAELSTAELSVVAGGGTVQPTPPQHELTYTCLETVFCTFGPYLTQGSSCDYC
jgi:hypothetical protein